MASSTKTDAEWIALIASKKRLDREKGLEVLKAILTSADSKKEEKATLETHIISLITSIVGPWENRYGGLMAAGLVIDAGVGSSDFISQVKSTVPVLLEEEESRVRIAAGEIVGKLCQHNGFSVFQELEGFLISGVRYNLERDQDVVKEHPDLIDKLIDDDSRSSSPSVLSDRPSSPSAAQIFHDTAGWKALETYLLALKQAVRSCGPSIQPFITTEFLELILSTLDHTNRFVRETGFKLIDAIVKCQDPASPTTEIHWPVIAQALAKGLADNWSQVRMAASIGTREFLTHFKTSESRLSYLPILLPAMCLNRYYVAEGVRLYSQETWRVVTELKGVQLVEQFVDNVVEYYISQSQAANHAVREAACICIAELGTKVSKDCLRHHVTNLVAVLLECFQDDSWPVRDAACLACGNFVACYPEDCRSSLDKLFPLFFGNLQDSIPSVRQGAAAAIASVVEAYGSEVEDRVFSVIKERLPLVADQPVSDSQSTIDPGPAMFGVVRHIDDNKDFSHTDQQMYSCGSLAPKMRRGGCMDSHFHKLAEPWEKSEGCVHLLAELSKQRPYTDKVASLLPLVAESGKHKHYSHHYYYLETLLKQLPVFAKSLGKRVFKRYVELFLDTIFYGLSCENALVKTAAVDCLTELTQLIGKMIIRGRIEQHNFRYVAVFDRTII